MSYDPEKQMLREIVWFILGIGDGVGESGPDALRCKFCGCHLLRAVGNNRTFGHRRHTKVTRKLTIHHEDENRENNAPKNLSLVHRSCHKRHHAQKHQSVSEQR